MRYAMLVYETEAGVQGRDEPEYQPRKAGKTHKVSVANRRQIVGRRSKRHRTAVRLIKKRLVLA